MSAITLIERVVPAADLPHYVGWNLCGAVRADGVLAWGELVSAEPITLPSVEYDRGYPTGPRAAMSIVHPRNVKSGTHWQSVREGALLALETPVGPYMVTVSHSAPVANPGDPHSADCARCAAAPEVTA